MWVVRMQTSTCLTVQLYQYAPAVKIIISTAAGKLIMIFLLHNILYTVVDSLYAIYMWKGLSCSTTAWVAKAASCSNHEQICSSANCNIVSCSGLPVCWCLPVVCVGSVALRWQLLAGTSAFKLYSFVDYRNISPPRDQAHTHADTPKLGCRGNSVHVSAHYSSYCTLSPFTFNFVSRGENGHTVVRIMSR